MTLNRSQPNLSASLASLYTTYSLQASPTTPQHPTDITQCADCRIASSRFHVPALGITLCSDCAQIHQRLHVHPVQVHHFDSDPSLPSPPFLTLGNSGVSRIWLARKPKATRDFLQRCQYQPTSNMEHCRFQFLYQKYRLKEFLWGGTSKTGSPSSNHSINCDLFQAVSNGCLLRTMEHLVQGGDPDYVHHKYNRSAREVNKNGEIQNLLALWYRPSTPVHISNLQVNLNNQRFLTCRATIRPGFIYVYSGEESTPIWTLQTNRINSVHPVRHNSRTLLCVITMEKQVYLFKCEEHLNFTRLKKALQNCLLSHRTETTEYISPHFDLICATFTFSPASAHWIRIQGNILSLHDNNSNTRHDYDLRKTTSCLELTQATHLFPGRRSGTISLRLTWSSQEPLYMTAENKESERVLRLLVTRAANQQGNGYHCQVLTDGGVPLILERCLSYIESDHLRKQGLYRVPVSQAGVITFLNKLKICPRDFRDGPSQSSMFVVSCAVKTLLAEMSEPLIPSRDFDHWFTSDDYGELLEQLSPEAAATLVRLVSHLTLVLEFSSENLVNRTELAREFGHLMFTERPLECGPGVHDQHINIVTGNDVCTRLLENLIDLEQRSLNALQLPEPPTVDDGGNNEEDINSLQTVG